MAVVIGGGGKLAARIAANSLFRLFFFLLTLEVFIAVLNLLAWRAAGAEAHKAGEVELYRVVAGSLNDELAVLVALALVLAGLGFDVLTAVAVRVAAFSCKKRKKESSPGRIEFTFTWTNQGLYLLFYLIIKSSFD